MVFSSNIFLFFFLPAALAAYFLTPKRFRNITLLIFSLVFYGWGEPVYLLLMVAVIVLNYVSAIAVDAERGKGRSGKTALVISIILNLGILGYFKYAGFAVRSLKALPFLGGLSVPDIALPIGISFYIFQSMSYTIDVYRGDASVQKNIINFGAYVSMFPQLIAGPIVRYKDIELQLEDRKESVDKFASGVGRFIVGLAKKVLLANYAGALWQELIPDGGTLSAWVGMAVYCMQLYFDFSGYSDMAIGLGRMMGFEFLENFRYPYTSKSMTEFWRRWHISLSTWFREYVYIPLGGNRCTLPRQILNIILVWGLTGLWHGANWNYVFWGLYSALFIMLEKYVWGRALKRAPTVLRRIYFLLVMMISMMIFYFEDPGQLGEFLPRLVSMTASSEHCINQIIAYLPVIIAGALACTPFFRNVYEEIKDSSWKWLSIPALVILLVLCVASLATQSYNPFIFFRF